jgi:hypothetical protein
MRVLTRASPGSVGDMQTDTPTVYEVVDEAAALTDPHGHDDAIRELLLSFEDDDRPARGVEDLPDVFASTAHGVDPEGDSPAVRVTAAVAAFLATQPEGGDDREGTLREAVRTAYGEEVPEPVGDWLRDEGVEL